MQIALWDRAKQYYGDKSIRWRIVFVVLALIILILLLSTPKKTFQSLYVGNAVYFADEAIPLNGAYILNQEKLDREIALMLYNPAQVVMLHKRELQYVPYIADALHTAGIPNDFTYLAIAESFLRPAMSPAGAAGIWQLMPDTARRYGLFVDDIVDQRLDFVKATAAAVRYLHDLYDIFGNRTLVAAAYNRGENGLQRDLARQNVTTYYDASLNDETARYLYRIVALKEILTHRYTYFTPQQL